MFWPGQTPARLGGIFSLGQPGLRPGSLLLSGRALTPVFHGVPGLLMQGKLRRGSFLLFPCSTSGLTHLASKFISQCYSPLLWFQTKHLSNYLLHSTYLFQHKHCYWLWILSSEDQLLSTTLWSLKKKVRYLSVGLGINLK